MAESDELAPGSKAGPPLEHTISAEYLTTTYKLPFKYNEKNGIMKVYKNGKWKACCQYCPKVPSYPGLCGRKRVCATHAKAVGSYQVQFPCRDCPPGNKVHAAYPDENNKPNSLCAEHAVLAGTHVESKSGASVIACECFDRWERFTGERIGHRVRYIACVGGSRTEGREMRGLIPGRRIQPDGYQEETETVWLFHGNYFHGYPPGHPRHETYLNNGKWGPDLYKKTMEQMALYVKHGYTVRYVWEHEYLETTRARCPVSLRDVVHTI